MTDGGKSISKSGFPTRPHSLPLKRHTLGRSVRACGGYQAIERLSSEAWVGASESRKDGQRAW